MEPPQKASAGAARPEEAEAEWIRRAAAGDRAAFGRLVERYQDAVMTAARYLVRDPEDAEDVAQEAFFRAYRSLVGFAGRSSFRTWLLTITANAARSFQARSRARKRSAPVIRIDAATSGEGGEAADIPEPEGLSSPESQAMRAELKQALEAAIAELDEESRTAVVLRDLAGESYEDIAAALGLPLGTVKSRIHRARLELRERLRPLL